MLVIFNLTCIQHFSTPSTLFAVKSAGPFLNVQDIFCLLGTYLT